MKKMPKAISISQLRALAKRRLPECVFNFYDSAAEDEVTASANVAAFASYRLVPRVLVDVGRVDLKTDILGRPSQAPLLIAPMGGASAAWPKADIAIAQAAAQAGIPYVLSTMATCSIEEVADAAAGRLWFQLYVLRDVDYTNALIDRALAAGYETLVIAVDVPTAGKRERDSLSLPMRWSIRTIADFLSHPRWLAQIGTKERPRFRNLDGLIGKNTTGQSVAEIVGSSLDASLNWERLLRLRERWPRKLVVKGVLSPSDARKLAGIGVDAVWVSNHGGRQLDGAIASAEALYEIARSALKDVPLIVDSGIRRGSDILKAVALGAHAVAIGRPAIYGVAAGGTAGATLAIEILLEELERCMKLCGVTNIDSITSDLIAGMPQMVN